MANERLGGMSRNLPFVGLAWMRKITQRLSQAFSRLRHDNVCDLVVAEALRQQVEQERLLNQVITQIRQSLELPVILETAVQQVRYFLQADRLIIFQFSPSLPAIAQSQQNSSNQDSLDASEIGCGQVTHEARANETIPSILNLTEGANCFAQIPTCRERYRKGHVHAVNDIETAYLNIPCLIELLQQAQVRAKLIVPLVVQEELWGLLVAHQCYEPRDWQESEKMFLQRIAEHLAIAIDQNRLYTQLQQQAQTLEQRVIERTRELHDALKAAQSASQTKTEFLSSMSHELRTPLTCIIGMSNTLLRMSQADGSNLLSPQRQQHYLRLIQSSGEHLLELINDILELSKIESGKAVLDIQEFSLSRLANDSVAMLKAKAVQQSVKLKLDLNFAASHSSLAALDTFIADPYRLQQILLNLLSNAVKFTPTGGQVTLRVWRENGTAVFQVEDTGIGIPKDQQPLIFQKFQQLDGSYQRQYEGTGLGLALTKQLVDLHNGWIEVESTVNVGSTFTVWIPAQCRTDSQPVSLPEADEQATQLVQGRIVLIEDQEETATIVSDVLTAAGYQVIWLATGAAVMQQLEILQPLTVVMNLHLAWIDSYDVLYSLRNNAATREIRILALTTGLSPEEMHYWQEAGVNDYITVPLGQPEQLLSKMTKLINRDQSL